MSALINPDNTSPENQLDLPETGTELVLANDTIAGAATIAKIGVDCSGSMGGVIDAANAGFKQAVTEMAGDEIACDSVVLSQYAFGGTAYKVAGPALPRDLRPKPLVAHGGTPGGAVVRMMLDDTAREQRAFAYEGTRVKVPWIFLVTDGGFTDDWQAAAKRARSLATAGKLNLLVAYLGSADIGQMTQMCADDQPPLPLDQLKFADFFKWVTASLINASRTGAGQAPAVPATTTWVAR